MRYFVIALVAIACTAPVEKFSSHGAEITSEDALNTDSFLSKVNDEDQEFKVRGTIEEVCQMKGCWMTLKNDKGANIRITFKDYGFFVPKDISGSEVIIEGIAKKEVLEEDVARHYAEDGGKEYDESMRNSITFVANGVLVKEG
ncbi:DUF4920 domain-containing protein [Ekhidna sp.]|jgi:hypothetical protein|uniref:DUF4920 domain-containing protein n=1 Tax=Ekhidna sp. TaxID=2608089 RepID=UPI0032EC3D6A